MKSVLILFSAVLVLSFSGLLFATDGNGETERDLAREIAEIRIEMEKLKADQTDGSENGWSAYSRNAPTVDSAFPIKVSGEIRIREEFWSGAYMPNVPAANFADGDETLDYTRMRTRLRFDVDVEEDLDLVIELQDVRIFGQELSTVGLNVGTSGVDIKRAEFLLHNAGIEHLTMEAGRFVMAYGDQRLIGHLEWVDQGRSYDGLRFQYKPDGYFADVFGVRIQDSLANDANDQDLFGVYGGKNDLFDFLGVEGYGLLVRDQRRLNNAVRLNNQDRNVVTIGTRLFGKKNAFDYTGELAYQTGRVAGLSLDAHAFAVAGGYTIPDNSMEMRVCAELDFASGDSNTTDSNSEQFQHMFPTNHAHYGQADLTNWSNIWDLSFGLSAKPADAITTSAKFHILRLDDADGGWANAGGAALRPNLNGHSASTDLGEEIDFTVKWQATKALSITGGYSHFWAGHYLDDVGRNNALGEAAPSKNTDFIFLQARVQF
jgi:hypothetical protein